MAYFNRCILLLLIPFLSSCRTDRSKAKHETTTAICNKRLFVETFTISGSGAFGGDRVSEYITDSTNFRIYIGTFDNAHEGYSFECFNDSIKISKIVDNLKGQREITSFRLYSISQLKISSRFD